MTENRIAQASLLISLIFSMTTEASAQKKPLDPCCGIIAVDVRTGIVTAKVNATGNVFEFKASNPATLGALKPGQPLFANFVNHQISLDGKTVCCTVTSAPRPAVGAAKSPTSSIAQPIVIAPIDPIRPPAITYGEPQPTQAARRPNDLSDIRPVTTRIGGRDVTTKVLRVRGLAGLQQASGIPEGARRLLEIHVQKLDPNESHDYIINTELAAQWMASHPHVPDDIQPPSASTRESCSGSDYLTKFNCDKQAVGDGMNGIQDLANGTWNHASDELTHDWHMAESCFADQTLPLSGIPVKFSITKNLTIPLSSVASGAGLNTSTHSESSSAKIDGSVGLGFPLEGDFVATLDLFYIPCLPFVVRPKSIAADGTMLVGETLTASVTASGKFDKTLKIPPTGGPKIPIEMIPIVIAGVPVAELDVSAYIEGNVEVGGSGKADGHFQISNPHKAKFAFSCNGGGCGSSAQQIPDPTTVSESAEIKGQLFVKPSVYTALQLDFDYDLLSARAGPQPYLLGMTSGCAEGSAQQTSDGASTSEENHVLTADLDWGVELRAEALVAGQVVGNPYVHSVTGDKHLWFRDLAAGGSTALVVNVQGANTAAAAKPVSYRVKMPSCYPYTNKVQYRVSWTGGAAPSANSQCQWQAGKGLGTCQADPTRDLVINLTWPAAGNYSLTVVPVGDDHHRAFSSAPQITQIAVLAVPGGG
ncbi:MAG TPA: hypothetical protein VGL17_12125 [Gemmatimonadaceae bacterium]